MKCPHCNKTLVFPQYAFHNATSYRQTVRVTTECCHKIVSLTPVYSVKVAKAEGKDYGNGPEDDWGVPEGDGGKLAYQKLDEKIAADTNNNGAKGSPSVDLS